MYYEAFLITQLNQIFFVYHSKINVHMCGYTRQVHITKRANIACRSILLKNNLQNTFIASLRI